MSPEITWDAATIAATTGNAVVLDLSADVERDFIHFRAFDGGQSLIINFILSTKSVPIPFAIAALFLTCISY
jgi:hypothetical protein